VTDRLIRITTALAVATVAIVAAVISYQHAFELVRSHGETGVTAAGAVHGGRSDLGGVHGGTGHQPARPAGTTAGGLEPGAGICATVGANLAHGVGHGPVGALVSAWPALALVGSFELLMMLIRTGRGARVDEYEGEPRPHSAQPLAHEAPLEPLAAPTLEQIIHLRYEAGHSQRAIARELNIDRRKVKRILDRLV
jgi:hypothetical protein